MTTAKLLEVLELSALSYSADRVLFTCPGHRSDLTRTKGLANDIVVYPKDVLDLVNEFKKLKKDKLFEIQF